MDEDFRVRTEKSSGLTAPFVEALRARRRRERRENPRITTELTEKAQRA